VLGIAEPTVGLLNIGTEELKGDGTVRTAAAMLRASDLPIGFHGFVEGNDITAGTVDVVVTDGFTGNVALKLLEGTIATLLDALRDEISATTRGRAGGLLIRPAARALRRRLDPDTYGGAYLLGLRGLVVIAHGNSSRRAIANAIRLAAHGVEHEVVTKLEKRLQETVLESARPRTPTAER
jgi:glycerol-3-phosphate acyltransferase PlsX